MIEHTTFWGSVGSPSGPKRGQAPQSPQGRPIWACENPHLRLYVEGEHLGALCSWHAPATRKNSPSVLAYGSFFVASNAEYDEKTEIRRLPIETVPEVVARLYEQHGTSAFALLDGDFSLVLLDPKLSRLFLVVDKTGCDDLYVRQEKQMLAFASDPYYLLDASDPLDAVAVAFLLGQEGFIPAPFTLAANTKAIGRARFLQISQGEDGLATRITRYWFPGEGRNFRSNGQATDLLAGLLKSAVEVRLDSKTAVLLSGGVDSSVVFQLAATRSKRELVALTGAVKGYADGEQEIEAAGYLARALGVPHEVVLLDPQDDALPDEVTQCINSWTNGARLVLPLWHRYAERLRQRFGDGYTALAGQTADTLADNNYTLPTTGYTLRRMFFSSWFLRWMPLLSRFCPARDSSLGWLAGRTAGSCAGARIGHMLACLLDGMKSRERFYAGRVFGYGEVPGLGRDYFPMWSNDGFAQLTDWYCSNFVRPVTQRLEPSSFYREMIELSMDMVMLHLDSRLLFHIYRLEGGRAQLPFMDTRLINFFCNLPYRFRPIWREPKHLIRSQLRRKGMVSPIPSNRQAPPSAKSQEELLLGGSIGAYFRELLTAPTFVNRVPGLFDLLDQPYLENQIRSFRMGEPGENHKFIAKVAALELWSRALAKKESSSLQHIAS